MFPSPVRIAREVGVVEGYIHRPPLTPPSLSHRLLPLSSNYLKQLDSSFRLNDACAGNFRTRVLIKERLIKLIIY